jgi:hypothetical protein
MGCYTSFTPGPTQMELSQIPSRKRKQDDYLVFICYRSVEPKDPGSSRNRFASVARIGPYSVHLLQRMHASASKALALLKQVQQHTIVFFNHRIYASFYLFAGFYL